MHRKWQTFTQAKQDKPCKCKRCSVRVAKMNYSNNLCAPPSAKR